MFDVIYSDDKNEYEIEYFRGVVELTIGDFCRTISSRGIDSFFFVHSSNCRVALIVSLF